MNALRNLARVYISAALSLLVAWAAHADPCTAPAVGNMR